MPYFMVDDQLPVNVKTKRLTELGLGGDVDGLAALGLWTLAGAAVQASLSDGQVSLTDLFRLVLDREIALRLAGLLVDAELWHTHGHTCPRCPPVAEYHWVFHDWFDLRYDRGVQTRTKRMKSQELKRKELVDAVWLRDCEDPQHAAKGRCRYCGKLLYRKTTRGPDRPTLDHVDPSVYAGVSNLALACMQCNQRKAARTPEQADMKLLPQPKHSQVDEAVADVSPGTPDAEMTPARSPVEVIKEAAPSTSTKPDLVPDADHTSGSVLARARGGERAGQGEDGSSIETVQRQRQPQPRSQARRRRRGRGGRSGTGRARTSTASQDAAPPTALEKQGRHGPRPEHNAGPAPVAAGAGRFGSPYYRWSGPPSDVTETTCDVHGIPDPCWKCLRTGAD